jgi:hypothetical protein
MSGRRQHFAPLQRIICTLALAFSLALSMPFVQAYAATPPAQNPQNGSIGLEGTKQSPPPTKGATILIPSTGQTFTNTPITVSGTCPTGLLVKIYSNNVFVGATECVNGTFSLLVDLFQGRNDLVARVFDSLDQAGPDSNIVSVFFNDSAFAQFGTRMFLTSEYARRGANPGDLLTWPIILSGGNGPYAISIDWGDNKPQDLLSRSAVGTFNITHVYDQAGIYHIIIKGVDANGESAFLQLVGVSNGTIQSNATPTSGNSSKPVTHVVWWPVAASIPLILVTFWLGQKFELASLRRHLERSAEEAEK